MKAKSKIKKNCKDALSYIHHETAFNLSFDDVISFFAWKYTTCNCKTQVVSTATGSEGVHLHVHSRVRIANKFAQLHLYLLPGSNIFRHSVTCYFVFELLSFISFCMFASGIKLSRRSAM